MGIILFLISIPTIYRGIINRINLEKTIYDWNSDIYLGAYIDVEIDVKDLMQTVDQVNHREIPIARTDVSGVIFLESTYLLNKEYQDKPYIPLIASGFDATGTKYYEFEEFRANNYGKYPLQGKVVQLKERGYYEIAMSVMGLKTVEEVDQIVNSEYAIELTDFNAERATLRTGIALMIVGLILLLLSIEKISDPKESKQ